LARCEYGPGDLPVRRPAPSPKNSVLTSPATMASAAEVPRARPAEFAVCAAADDGFRGYLPPPVQMRIEQPAASGPGASDWLQPARLVWRSGRAA